MAASRVLLGWSSPNVNWTDASYSKLPSSNLQCLVYLATHYIHTTHRARVRQLEAEDAEHTSRVATVESRAVSEMRAEQESCLKKISEAETRHQARSGLPVVVQLSIHLVPPSFTTACDPIH